MRALFFLLLLGSRLEALVDLLSVSGSPPLMTINAATAGSQPDSVMDSSTTYSGLAVLSSKITGNLNAAMPTGVTLQVQLQAPSGTSSAGLVTMGTTASNLVTGLVVLAAFNNLTITYRLSATVSAAIHSNVSRTLTLTLQ